MLKHRQYVYFYIFSRATPNETVTAKYDGVLPRTPQVRPKSEIYTPKRDDEHPHPFHMGSPPRDLTMLCLSGFELYSRWVLQKVNP